MTEACKRIFLGFALAAAALTWVWAGPLPRQEVPDPLKPWISWSLHGQEEAACPSSFNASGEHRCLWPGELALELGDRGGTFRQSWELFAPGWVPLPAGERFWPQEVSVDGKPATVVGRSDAPAVFLGPGRHLLAGRFAWDRLPESLNLPPMVALVRLSIEGKTEDPRIERDGRLWLRGGTTTEPALEDRLQLQVFRKLSDDNPAILTTRLVLDVSGRPRELLLGRALPDGFLPAALHSPLPVRLEPDGRVRVQVRAGRWDLEILARHQGPLDHLAMAAPQEPWPAEEVWSFEARPQLRLVTLEGLTPIDPQQTRLPPQWSGFPAFLARPGQTLTLQEKRRGDPDPAPDQLSLQRTLWLDFDGQGFTVQDRISGSMTRGWRLTLLPPAELGRVAIDGVDRFITRTQDSPGAGVEVRRGRLDLTADSRLEKRTGTIPAAGWDRDFVSAQATLNLPPGWRLLHAAGADAVPGTWITRWSLFDLFVVLLISLAVGRLWGWPWGGLALLALGLSYHEPEAPRWVWLHLLAAVALVRVLPSGRVRTLAGLYRNLSLVALLILFLPFAVNQIRSGIYPQLEPGYGRADQGRRAPAEDPLALKGKSALRLLESMDSAAGKMAAVPETSSLSGNGKGPGRFLLHDPDAKVQTGPGLPQWQWRAIPIRFSGPVKASQQLRLIFLSPRVNLLLSCLRVVLLGLLAWPFLGLRREGPGTWRLIPKAGWLPVLVAGLVAWSGPARAAFPAPELLDQLQKRLLAPAECFPRCAEIQSLDVGVSPDRLTLDLLIHSGAHVAVPLPGARNQWLPERVRLDGRPAPLYLDAAGQSWLPVTAGSHRVLLEGLLPGRESVTLPLPLPPRRVRVSGQGWEMEGLDGVWPPQQLQLRRLDRDGEKRLAPLEAAALPPFFRVERTLSLGLQWTVSTRVVRFFGGGGPAVVAVPLLPGEAVTSAGVAVADGRVTLNIPAGADEAGWESVLEVVPRLALHAAADEPWSESWRLDVSPIWHVEWQGIPVVHHQDPAGNWLPEWRPWPGEGIELLISRPQGVGGQTLTVDDSLLTVRPGNRAAEVRLEFHLRSSQGGQHTLTLPEQAELQGVSIDGRSQPIRQEGRQVTIPLVPGEEEIALTWRSPEGISALLQTPAVQTGTPSVNARIALEMPRERWVLLAGGPRLGPAVLFWGVLLVLIPIAFGLGQSSLTPLRFRHWLLLGIGLTQLAPVNALLVVGWLLALGVRGRLTLEERDWAFNFLQIGLAVLTGFALLALLVSVQQGLLGYPDMQIAGNGSAAGRLLWYQDRAASLLPRAWVLSVPMLVYRLLMLAWALWLAMALLRWLQWGWKAFSHGGLWRPVRLRRTLKQKEKT